MANPNNKRYMSVEDIKKLDIGKELNKSLAERQALLHKLAGTASNIYRRMENAGVDSFAKSMLERTLGAAGKTKKGMPHFTVPTAKTSQLIGTERAFRPDGTAYTKYNYTGKSLNALVNERIQTMFKFISSPGSTIKGAKQELKDAQERFHNESITQDDLKRIWDLYEEHRKEIESITEGSPIYQTLIGYWVASGLDDDDIHDLIKKDLEKHGKPSKIDEQAEVEVDW